MGYVRPTHVVGMGSAIGTGSVVLTDVVGWASWSSVPDGSIVHYTIEDDPRDNQFEWGLGTKTTVAGSVVLVRGASNVLGGSAGPGALVNFTGPNQVIYAVPLGEVEVLPNVGADPSVASPGQIIFRTDTQHLRFYNGSAWVDVGTGTGVTSFNGRTGSVTLTSGDVTTALGDANIAYRDVANTFTVGPQVFNAGLTSPLGGAANVNEAFGKNALASATTATGNTAVGYNALNSADGPACLFNTAVGYLALQANTTGYYNTALGASALAANTTGIGNFACGVSALAANTTGSNSTAIGQGALQSVVSGGACTAIGYGSLRACTNTFNCGLGLAAGWNLTTGNFNFIIDVRRVDGTGNLTTGSYNVLIGSYADVTAGGVSYAIALGYQAAAGNNECALGPYISQMSWHGLSSTSTDRIQFLIVNGFNSSTDASYSGQVDFQVKDFAGIRTFFSAQSNGSVAQISFFGAAKVSQQNTTGTTQQTSAGTGTAIKTDSTTTGGTGTTAYTVADIVLALKNYGLLAA